MLNTIQFFGALEIGILFGFIAWGVYLSLRILQFPDMTIDSSFVLGASVAAILIVHDCNPWLATLCAALAGAMAGVVTAWLSMRWKILHLLAGILTMTALISINLRIMQGPNVALFNMPSIFTPLAAWSYGVLFLLTIIALVLIYILYRFLISEHGLAMRAAGANPRMAQALGIAPQSMVFWGLGLANSLVALGGALFAQSQGFADVSMGIGTLIEGLAAVIIGEALWPSRKLWIALLRCLLGSIFYRLIIAMALNLDSIGLQASDLKLVTALIVGLAMILPQFKTIALPWKRRPS